MNDQLAQASGCQLQRVLSTDRLCETFHAVENGTDRVVRLTLLSAEAFADCRFREVYKTDRARLIHLRHAAIAGFMRDSEFGDRLYFLQESRDWPTLRNSSRRHALSADDIVEIGWQLCSALQLAHNVGICHGGISEDTILLSDEYRVLLVDFRLAVWRHNLGGGDLAAADGQTAAANAVDSSMTRAATVDLKDMVGILLDLDRSVSTSSPYSDTDMVTPPDRTRQAALQKLLQSFDRTSIDDWRYSARDVQGRLGELLIGDGQEAMAIVDRRTDASHPGSSIVEELFDQATQELDEQPSTLQPNKIVQLPILPIVIGAVLAVFLLWAAGLLG
jgi:serine/threonine protein kinase